MTKNKFRNLKTLRRSLLMLLASVLCLTTATAQDSDQSGLLTNATMANSTVVLKNSDGEVITNGASVKVGDVLSVSVTPADGYYFSDGTTDTKSGSITVTEDMLTETAAGTDVEPNYATAFEAVSGTWTLLSETDTYYTKTSGWKVELNSGDYDEKNITYTATSAGTLTFDYAVNNGSFVSGMFYIYLYVNGDRKKTYNYYYNNSDGNQQTIQSESGVSVAEGDVIKWGFRLMEENSPRNCTGYLGNVKIATTGAAATIDLSSGLASYAVHQHDYDATTGLCTVCSAKASYTLSDFSSASKLIESMVVTRGEEALEAGETMNAGDEITASITLTSCAMWSDDASLAATTARNFTFTVGGTDPNEIIREKIALAGHVQTGMVSGVCNICGYYAALTDADLVDGAYQLKHAGDLMAFSDITNGINGVTRNTSANAKVADDADIDFTNITSVSYTPIGTGDYYKGAFDGNGKTITLNINSTSPNQALIGRAYSGTTIKNVNVAGTVRGSNVVAGLVAFVKDGNWGGKTTITNCHNYATIISTTSEDADAAGIVAYTAATSCTVTGCSNNATISGEGNNVGGIVGYSWGPTTIIGCVNNGDIICGNANAGGIVGYVVNAYASITACVNRGTVTATNGNDGAIAGYFQQDLIVNSSYNENSENSNLKFYGYTDGSSTPTFTRCYNINNVEDDVATNFSAGALASGELCYNLNGGTTDLYWYQELGKDATPVLTASDDGTNTVYQTDITKIESDGTETASQTYYNVSSTKYN